MTAIVPVACAVLINEKGECLLGSRPEGKPFAGWWEFPGGKMEGAESIAQTVQRELKEELGLRVENCAPWVTLVHTYPHATVKLHFARSWDWQGEPRALEGQKFGFFEPGQWPEPLLKASEPIARWLSLPKHWLYLKTAQAVEKLKEEIHRHFDGAIVSAAVINHLDALKPQLKALGVSEIWCDDTVELEKMKQFDGVWVNDFTSVDSIEHERLAVPADPASWDKASDGRALWAHASANVRVGSSAWARLLADNPVPVFLTNVKIDDERLLRKHGAHGWVEVI